MFCTPYTHLWSVGWLEAVGGGAGVPAVVLGGDAAEAEGGAALVEGGVALLVPLHLEYSIIVMLFNNKIFKSLHLEGPRVCPDLALDLDQPLALLDLAAVRQRDERLVKDLQGQLGLPNLEVWLPSVTMFTICDQISPSVTMSPCTYMATFVTRYHHLWPCTG